MKAALAFAIALFASLPEERHGVCRVQGVYREPAHANHWWACGSCEWRGRPLLAAVLIACDGNGDCRWIQHVPDNADLGLCERVMRDSGGVP